MPELKWTEQKFGSETLTLGKGLIYISCFREAGRQGVINPTPYRYTLNGMEGKTHFSNMEDCKTFAFKQAEHKWKIAGAEAGWV